MGVNVSKTSITATNIADINNRVTEQACDEDKVRNVIKNAEFTIQNTNCGNIAIGTQNAVSSCQARLAAAVSATVPNIASAAGAGSDGNFRMNFGPTTSACGGLSDLASALVNIDITTEHLSNTTELTTYITQICGSNSAVQNLVKSVSLDMSDVSCKQAKLFTQRADAEVGCVQGIAQSLLQNNGLDQKTNNRSWWNDISRGVWGAVILGVVLLIFILILVAIIRKAAKHRQQGQAAPVPVIS